MTKCRRYLINELTSLTSFVLLTQDMEQFETEVKSLQAMVKQAQVTLTSPELARLCLKEQLFQRQVPDNVQYCTEVGHLELVLAVAL